MSPKCWQNISNINIYIFNLQIFSHCFQHISNANVNVNSPTLHQRSHRNPSTDIYPPSFGRIYQISIFILKLQIFTNYWQHISNTNVYITKFLFPPAWRAHRNLSTDICPPSVSRIYPIFIYIDIGYIWMLNLQIFPNCWQHIQYKCIFPPAGRLKGTQKLFNWHIHPNCWQNISIYNINLYIQLTNVPAYMFFIICIFFMFYMWTPGNIIFDVLGHRKAHISPFL